MRADSGNSSSITVKHDAPVRIVALLVALTLGGVVAAYALARPHHPPGRSIHVAVLMYHRIGHLPTDPTPTSTKLTVQPRVFAAQMEWLARHGFHAITVRQLYAALERREPLPSRPVLITFDDGYRDILFNAAPVLHRLAMPAAAFIITDRVNGPDASFLTWENLRALERDGFTIGSHTVHHLHLPSIPPWQAWAELRRSRATLQQHLGEPVDWFAYPGGAENASVVQLVRKAGYRLAFTTQAGFTQYAREPLLLHRDEIARSDGLAGFAALLDSGQ
jgi:peptidoglycan/xylan/chitin deacetylase (PgdA/CDA1 family)